MTTKGINYLITRGILLPLIVSERQRWVYALQAESEAAHRRAAVATNKRTALRRADAARETRDRWMEVRLRLPDIHRPYDISADLTPRPSPDPLPIQGVDEQIALRSRGPYTRQRRGLYAANRLKWIRYVGADEDGHVIELPSGGRRQIPSEGVNPYLHGFATALGEGAKMAYRPWLG